MFQVHCKSLLLNSEKERLLADLHLTRRHTVTYVYCWMQTHWQFNNRIQETCFHLMFYFLVLHSDSLKPSQAVHLHVVGSKQVGGKTHMEQRKQHVLIENLFLDK